MQPATLVGRRNTGSLSAPRVLLSKRSSLPAPGYAAHSFLDTYGTATCDVIVKFLAAPRRCPSRQPAGAHRENDRRAIRRGRAGGLATSAAAQPPGSYRDSCRDIRMQGSVLTALCRRAGGRGEQLTALNVANCVGDIGNNNGNLVCNGGQPARPASPPPSAGYPGYPAQGYYGSQPGSGYPSGPGYPMQGYGPQPGPGYYGR